MGRYNFIEKKGDKALPPVEEKKVEASAVSNVVALYRWNFSRDDDDRPDDIEILVKPIEASTPLPEDLPTGFFPQGGVGHYGFAGERAWAFEMIDRDRRFMYDTSIGGVRPRDISNGNY
jgi:hypothetical protein